MLWGYQLMNLQVVDLMVHFSTNTFDKARGAIFQEAINSLTAIDGHERQYFNELRGTVVSRRIFIRSQSLIAR